MTKKSSSTEKLKITIVSLEGDQGIYVGDDRVFHGEADVSEEVIDSLVEGVLDAVGAKFAVVTETVEGEPYLEYHTDFIPESLREMKKALKDIDKGTYRGDDEEDEDGDY